MATPLINPYNTYIGNGVATEFAISFPYTDSSYVHVYLKRYDGEEVELTTNDYGFQSDTVIVFPKTGSSEGILRTNDKLTIQRETPVESEFEFSNQKRLFPEDVMAADDLSFQILQEHAMELDRALKLTPTSSVEPDEAIMQVERVYASIDNIDDVADNIADVNAVADISDKIPTVAGIDEDVSTVAGISANVTTVAGDKTNIDTVAGNTTNINTVAGISSNVTTVAGIASNVTAVANDRTNIDAVAADLANIDAASGRASDAAASALLSQAWATKMDTPVSGTDYSSKYYAQAAEEIYDRIGTVIKIIGRVNTVADLPASGNTNGDCYLVGLQGTTDFDEYYWFNDHWEFLGTTAVTLDFASIEGDPTDNTALANALSAKQDTLVSGTNIKTLNGSTILGSGDLELSTYHPTLFTFQWSDCLKNDVQWLRADTFSWQSGAVYEAAYNHLVDDIDGKTAQTETVAGVTVTFYLADDGHKIVDVANISAVESLYAATGVAWYYVIDTANERFKLPRTKYGFTGLRGNVGDFVEAGLPNITGEFRLSQNTGGFESTNQTLSGVFYSNKTYSSSYQSASGSSGNVAFDASRSSSIYGNSTTVQPPATEMYLYFYVGSFTQTAIENTAGLNSELFNGKLDLDVGNATQNTKQTIVGWGMPDYSAGVSLSDITTSNPYTAPADGYLYCTVYNCTAYVNGSIVAFSDFTANSVSTVIILSKNDVVTVSQNNLGRCNFYPCKGV